MKNKKYLFILLTITFISVAITAGILTMLTNRVRTIQTESIAVKTINTTIAADGAIHSQNEAILHFSTGGKVVYVPFKEGDSVYKGQTIAQLDTYPLQQQLTMALNTYRSTRDSFDQVKDNVTNSIIQSQQKAALQSSLTNATPLNANDDHENNIVNDIVKRLVDQSQANLDNSVIQVQLTNYALQLATLTSPINGIVIHEDVTVPNIFISPTTAFVIVDPASYVFKANIPAQDIDFITMGAVANIQLTGNSHTYTGTVIRLYPQKITLASGQDAYQVDIQTDGITNTAIYGQTGTVTIASLGNQTTILVPVWTILSHNKIWIMQDNKPILQTITTGKTHGNFIEVLSGLTQTSKIIVNPQAIAAERYQAL